MKDEIQRENHIRTIVDRAKKLCPKSDLLGHVESVLSRLPSDVPKKLVDERVCVFAPWGNFDGLTMHLRWMKLGLTRVGSCFSRRSC